MLRARSALLGVALVVAMVAVVGCSSSRSPYRALPTDLPTDPEICTKYCKVWVDPVYREVPRLVMTKPGCVKRVPEEVCETRYREVCVKPGCTYEVRQPGKQCEQAVVQVKPGGYKWKRDGDCWRYCYEEPCYDWCNKIVQEEGIEYCMDAPPEYRVEAYLEPVTRYRDVRVPAQYDVEYCKELYTPGHYEWQPTKECLNCDCPTSCEPVPQRKSPCRDDVGITGGCPRTN